MTIIAHITDLHLGTGNDVGAAENDRRLNIVLDRIKRLRRQPDALIATGDLTETGSVAAFKVLKEKLDGFGLPYFPCLGNHDLSSPFHDVFGGEYMMNDRFCQYHVDIGDVSMVVIDTHGDGTPGGQFCDVRASWLDDTLAKLSDRPVILAHHHPPFEIGINWMDSHTVSEEWVASLKSVVSRHRNIKKMIGGHSHRPVHRTFAGVPCFIASAVAAEVDLEFAEVRSSFADGRPLIVDEPPGFALHLWDGEEIVTHMGIAGEFDVNLYYEDDFIPAMRDVLSVPE